MSKRRKSVVAFSLVAAFILVLSSCATPTPQVIKETVIVEKEVEVEKVVTEIVKETVKETVVVAGTPKVVEKEVTKVVQVEVTPEGDWLARTGGVTEGPPVYRMPKDGFYFDTIGYGDFHMDWEPPPLDHVRQQWKDRGVSDEGLEWLRSRAERLRSETDKALVLGGWQYMGLDYADSLTDWWALLARDPGYVKGLFALSTEVALRNLPLLWEALGENVDVVAVTGLDFGTQRSEWFSPEVFREVYMPGLRTQFGWIKQNTTWKTFEHSCGSIPNLIGDLADAGLDALNPVQTSAAGMGPVWLKETFGDRVTFWGGGVETQSTLPFGTPEQVRHEVRERMDIFAPGGGFVFCPVHNIQPCTPPENIIAAYETAREWRP